MRAVNPAAQAIRARRGAIHEVPMLWVSARRRDNDEIEGVGLWGGQDAETITVPDMWLGALVTRTFTAAGALLQVGPIRHEVGFAVRSIPVRLSSASAQVALAIRGYDPRGAKVQVWRRCYDPDTMQPVGVEAVFKGKVERVPISRPVPGGSSEIEMTIVSTAASLTIAPGTLRSDESYQRLGRGRLLRYASIVDGVGNTPWGVK